MELFIILIKEKKGKDFGAVQFVRNCMKFQKILLCDFSVK